MNIYSKFSRYHLAIRQHTTHIMPIFWEGGGASCWRGAGAACVRDAAKDEDKVHRACHVTETHAPRTLVAAVFHQAKTRAGEEGLECGLRVGR